MKIISPDLNIIVSISKEKNLKPIQVIDILTKILLEELKKLRTFSEREIMIDFQNDRNLVLYEVYDLSGETEQKRNEFISNYSLTENDRYEINNSNFKYRKQIDFPDKIYTSRITASFINRINEESIKVAFEDINRYKNKILSGTISRLTRDLCKLYLKNAVAIIYRNEQLQDEYHNLRYYFEKRKPLKFLVLEVLKKRNSVEIIGSRKRITFIEEIFKINVPKVKEGIIKIKDIEEIPYLYQDKERFKYIISLTSEDKNLNIIRECCGIAGKRIKAIIQELNRQIELKVV